jgi:hypothetical protein
MDRRWISDDYFDLIVWYDPDGAIHGFQLCYDKAREERALTWMRDLGFRHTRIDGGETSPFANQTPVLAADGEFSAAQVRAEFIARSGLLPAEIRGLVLAKMEEYERRKKT